MTGRWTTRDLNRTLLARQHLLERTTMPAVEMVGHLVGLQAQENLPPYLSLAARLDPFDPHELSGALERGEAVRLLTMRGTIHVLTALQSPRQLVRVEGIEPRGQGEVRREVLLRLQADEVLDHRQCRDRGAREQVLAQQQRPVEVPAAQHPSTLEVSDGRP